MTTGATGQLGLALPVQGELSGTWGDTVNNGITEYTNIAIAATLTLTNDGAVTLANTTGDASASNITSSLTGAGTVTAQFAIVKVTGTLTTTKVVTFGSAGSAPYSKTYLVVNAATGGSVSFTAYGGTGVTIAVGESAYVYYDGTNIVKVSSTVATGVTTFSAGTTGFTPSTATSGAVTLAGTLATTNGGTGLTSFTSGTAIYASSTSALSSGTLPTTGGGTGLTSFTANGVVYASSTSALATGSALVFDGTNLGVGVTPSAWTANAKAIQIVNTSFSNDNYSGAARVAYNLYQDTNTTYKYIQSSLNAGRYDIGSNGFHAWYTAPSGTAGNTISFTQAMTLDASGNLGIGTTTPSNRVSIVTASGSDGILSVKSPTTDTAGVTIDGGSTSNKGALLTFAKDATTKWRIGIDSAIGGGTSNNLNILGSSTDALLFGTNSAERARISSAGGFSVGTTADPGAGAIYATGNITAYYSSDIKFKENVRDIPDALATVNAIGGKLFDWTDEYIESKGGADGYFVQKADFGVVAQDVQKVFPIAVRTRPDGSLAVDYEKLGALAFAAVGELTTLVQTLTARVEALEAK